MKVVNYQSRLPREVVESLCLEIFTAWLGKVLDLLWAGAWTRVGTSQPVWFHYSMILWWNIPKTSIKETAFNLNIAALNLSTAKLSLIKNLLSWRDTRFFHPFRFLMPFLLGRHYLNYVLFSFLCIWKNLHFTIGLQTVDCRITPSVKTAGVFYSFWLYCPASHRQYAITLRKIKDITQQWCMTLPSHFHREAQHCSKAPISR